MHQHIPNYLFSSGVIQSYNTIFTQDRSDELKLSVTSIDELIERITIGLKEMDEVSTELTMLS